MYIQVKNLTKSFKNNFAVNKINFHIEKNKTVGLLGPNGCGKTTSIGMILGLIEPSEGEIIINNKNLKSFKRHDILAQMNFASPYIELPKKLTVKQNLEVYGRLYGVENLNNRINEISEEVKSLSELARDGKLKSEQLRGGTFTISVLGSVDGFTPILNQGQVAILGIGRSQKKPVVVKNDIAIKEIMTISLTVDHQAIDGAIAANFCRRLQQLIEKPSRVK